MDISSSKVQTARHAQFVKKNENRKTIFFQYLEHQQDGHWKITE